MFKMYDTGIYPMAEILVKEMGKSIDFKGTSCYMWPTASITSLVHRRASISYLQARSCYCGQKWECSVVSGGTLGPEIM